jgi:hypothetical protein
MPTTRAWSSGHLGATGTGRGASLGLASGAVSGAPGALDTALLGAWDVLYPETADGAALAGTISVAVTTSGALTVPKPLAGFVAVAVTVTGTLTGGSPGGPNRVLRHALFGYTRRSV